MKERPIIMTGESVRAILDGRKTQTRRVVKPQPVERSNYLGGWVIRTPRATTAVASINLGAYPECYPYGQPGDRLWVRETWGTVRMHELGQHIFGGPRIPDHDETVYRAGRVMGIPIPDTSPVQFKREWRDDFQPSRWRSPIHMHRWLSRITLEITGVRVERVQDITPADATAEAATDIILNPKHPLRPAAYERGQTIRGERYAGIIQGYAALWDSLYERRGYGWDVNPWVWVIEFKRVEQDAKVAAA